MIFKADFCKHFLSFVLSSSSSFNRLASLVSMPPYFVMNVIYLGIDLAKNVFQLCGLNQSGKPVYKKRPDRKTLLQIVANIPACLIGVEASTGAFYWQHEFEKLGHKVKVISPQYVKPFVRGHKNDGNDAQAIAIALMQPTMQFVPPKSPEQQDIQALHWARQRIVNHRTATVCQIRGLLLDRGITIGTAVSRVSHDSGGHRKWS
ncbi:hypothetical protein BML2537_09010 [Providencia stuartii]|nr:hypothetical protein BML2537_09010 [Providencia stuartii]